MKENKIFIVLIIIILLFGGILALKVTGVIKPKPIDYSEETISKYDNDMEEIDKNKEGNTAIGGARKFFYKIITANIMAIGIAISIIGIGLKIGTAKLYAKLGMPSWTVKYALITAFSVLILALLPTPIDIIFNAVTMILSMVVLGYYFKALEMSTWTPVLILIPVAGIIIVLVEYIISNIRLGKMFDKGVLFTIGLVILPGLFQPILGYQEGTKYSRRLHEII